VRAVPGYSGGDVDNPTYEQVSTGRTGHAEVTQVTFDSSVISFRKILEIFFSTHDPTTRNRQGADVGTQYRSIILYHTGRQREEAEAYIKELETSGRFKATIVTEVKPFRAFYEAEEYHKGYFERNRDTAYSKLVIEPKVEKLKKFKEIIKEAD
jgi:peptide-methionine (S)-S-oxide reductase